ncbi:MmcQ/YjbR family DNA-binding protein [Dyadobacter sediminis]|uniref:MmcQ/YjbR family DNA-binding protein n=1 Tax=Dyadobacter sediminis TaxID=1493691 RepID=A0A5R9K4C0_9BACT|nr:MmcQ/YjbR family DNA-binding protein [Dyadobacter sediminis]TLU88701.1 MmcQ/YjbR family DNA-binding protein [Dyadobacter sediminis]GGC14002.1 hypothetical protein GCM10011325_46170 [Dyadobacter sediminis]
MALTFPEVTQEPHFEKISFRVKKKIFATYDEQLKRASIKLSEVDQSVFCSGDQTVIFPVDNKWGKQGWTLIEMEKVHQDLFKDALTTAYCTVAPQKLADLVRMDL